MKAARWALAVVGALWVYGLAAYVHAHNHLINYDN